MICRFNRGKTNYWTGEPVMGTIEFINRRESKLRLKSINAALVGQLVYLASESSNKGLRTYEREEVFFEQPLFPHSSSDQNEVPLQLGNDTWPFSVLLEHPLPPSIKKVGTKGPFIEYFVRVQMVRKEWYKMNIVKKFPIIVQCNSSSPVNVTRIEKQNVNRKDVHIHVVLPKNVVVAGNKFVFDIAMRNPNQVSINSISATLTQVWNILSKKTQRIDLFRKDLAKITLLDAQRFNKSFELHIPHTAPTFSFELDSDSDPKPLIVSYVLSIRVFMVALFGNINLEFPLIITNTI